MLPVPHIGFTMRNRDRELQFVRPADPESILDSMTDEEYEKDKLLPYWAEQWPASFALFHFLGAHWSTALPTGGIVCELGSGLGLVCAIMAHYGVRCVATDISLDACRFSRHNILLHAPIANAVCTDWRQSCFQPVFDCVVASDVIYEERWVQPVLDFLNQTLVPGGLAYIADPCRQWWNLFRNRARGAGYSVTVAWEEQVNEGKTRVEILCLRRIL